MLRGGYAALITILGISIFDYVQRFLNCGFSLVESGAPFPVWMIFYVMGVLKAQGLKLPFESKKPLLLAFFSIGLCCLHMLLLYVLTGNVVPGIKLSAHIYSYFAIMWLFSDSARERFLKVQNNVVCRLLAHIGKVSFFIYLTHVLVLFVIGHIGLPPVWLLLWGLGAVLSCLLAFCGERLCKGSLGRLLGF
ncbi:MAG: acyltransferase family protein [Marinilabiliaceae bacterium]